MSQHLTIIEAAKYLGRSTKTIRKYIKDRKLKAIMEEMPGGHRYVIPLESLEAFTGLQSSSNGSTMEGLEVVPPVQTGMEVLENIVMGMESRLLEATREDLQALKREIIEEVLAGMEKKKWWQQLFPFWK